MLFKRFSTRSSNIKNERYVKISKSSISLGINSPKKENILIYEVVDIKKSIVRADPAPLRIIRSPDSKDCCISKRANRVLKKAGMRHKCPISLSGSLANVKQTTTVKIINDK